MDEFSPGEKKLHSEKLSNVSKNSSKKYQLRADVKQKIKQRLHRNKSKENYTTNRTATGYKSTTEINKGSCIAKVAEKLWSMKRNPHLCTDKFVYAGRVPCFLKRNIKKVDKKSRTRYIRPIKHRKSNKSLCLFPKRRAEKTTKEFYFRFIKHKNSKRPASGCIDNDRVKRLCLEPEDSDGRIGITKTVDHLANGKVDNKRLCRNPQKQTLARRDKPNHNNDDLEIWSKNASYKSKRSRCKTKLSFEIGGETIKQENSECNESQRIFKETSNMENNSEAFKINMVRKYPSENSRQVSSPISNKEKVTRELSVSLMDCKLFANCLHSRQTLSNGSFQTTSTPRAIRVPTKSQDIPALHITPSIPTLNAQKVLKLQVNRRVPTSIITPPQSEVSCTEDESSFSIWKEEFNRDKFYGSSTEKNARVTKFEGIVYKPLFSNRPRLWKSVVVENES